MNPNNQDDNASQFVDTNQTSSGFTPATASFNSTNAGIANLSPDAIEDMEVDKAQVINDNLNLKLGLSLPPAITQDEIPLYNSFFDLMRNMYKWEMLSDEEIDIYYKRFIPTTVEEKQQINSDLDRLYRTKLSENLVIQQYLDEEENFQEWQDLFDSLDPVSQEKLIYYIQTNQEMPKELLEKVVEEERKAMEIGVDGEPDLIIDEETEAYAKKNLEKVLNRRGFSASTLTSKDVSELVNARNSQPAQIPVRPNIPPVRVPNRTANAQFVQPNSETFPVQEIQPTANFQPNIQQSMQAQSSYQNNQVQNGFSPQFQQVNLPNIQVPVQQNMPVQPNPQAAPIQQNIPPSYPTSYPQFNNADASTAQRPINTLPKPIAGLNRPPKGLDDLLGNHK